MADAAELVDLPELEDLPDMVDLTADAPVVDLTAEPSEPTATKKKKKNKGERNRMDRKQMVALVTMKEHFTKESVQKAELKTKTNRPFTAQQKARGYAMGKRIVAGKKIHSTSEYAQFMRARGQRALKAQDGPLTLQAVVKFLLPIRDEWYRKKGTHKPPSLHKSKMQFGRRWLAMNDLVLRKPTEKKVLSNTDTPKLKAFYEHVYARWAECPVHVNVDESALFTEPGMEKVVAERGQKVVGGGFVQVKERITVVLATAHWTGPHAGTVLQPFFIIQGTEETSRKTQLDVYRNRPDCYVNENGWQTSRSIEKCMQFFRNQLAVTEATKVMWILDNFGPHHAAERAHESWKDVWIFGVPNLTHIWQPVDVGFAKSFKDRYRRLRNEYESTDNRSRQQRLEIAMKCCAEAIAMFHDENMDKYFVRAGLIPSADRWVGIEHERFLGELALNEITPRLHLTNRDWGVNGLPQPCDGPVDGDASDSDCGSDSEDDDAGSESDSSASASDSESEASQRAPSQPPAEPAPTVAPPPVVEVVHRERVRMAPQFFSERLFRLVGTSERDANLLARKGIETFEDLDNTLTARGSGKKLEILWRFDDPRKDNMTREDIQALNYIHFLKERFKSHPDFNRLPDTSRRPL